MTRDREATSRRILEAARDLFAAHGYDQVTMRMIAAEAGANVALVNRYFGTKAALFAEALATGSTIESVIAGDPAGLAARLAHRLAVRLQSGATEPVTRMVDRAGTSPEIQAILRAHVEATVVKRIAAQLDGPQPEQRALLAATMILGTGSVRRLFGPGVIEEVDAHQVEERLREMFEICLRP
ncbi:TetR family transcriptional regulator [Herbidospora sp. NEAU-GS84]|uniref:TetR family transcriptional regulator n=1 Tax=Herbidospora solisilvae TaxID=2696284 RepID=A0A7C9NHI6_9ACTN|nr:TetR/AcrR family transcriptional regulator [Herbidospora solisilvae]NAS22692.1 TetR family transcriptional regulator [Herbidospora solisilvae]